MKSAQSDQSLRCGLNGYLRTQTFFMRIAKADQTGRTPKLIWVYAGRKCHFVGFVMRWLNYLVPGTCAARHSDQEFNSKKTVYYSSKCFDETAQVYIMCSFFLMWPKSLTCTGKSHDQVGISRLIRGGVRQKFLLWVKLAEITNVTHFLWFWLETHQMSPILWYKSCRHFLSNSNHSWGHYKDLWTARGPAPGPP